MTMAWATTLSVGSGDETAARGPSAASGSARQNKLPALVLAFWIIKIAATTLGETGGDTVSMSLNLGYLAGSVIFAAFFSVAAAAQMAARRFNPFLYWTAVVSTTTAGTTMADFADRSLGIGYLGGTLLLFASTLAVLAAWRWTIGEVEVRAITSRKAEAFYWLAILVANTLGTALGDFLAASGPGYEGGALIFAAALAVIAGFYYLTGVSRVLLFWSAYILTRPLGATLGDLLTKPKAAGGLDLDRATASFVLLAFILACLLVIPQRAGDHAAPMTRRGGNA